jgi:hypothetical protein
MTFPISSQWNALRFAYLRCLSRGDRGREKATRVRAQVDFTNAGKPRVSRAVGVSQWRKGR